MNTGTTKGESRIQDAILFDINEGSLADATLTEHVSRLQSMNRFLCDAIDNNRINLDDLRETVKSQVNSLKTRCQVLQNSTKQEINRLKNYFEPIAIVQAKKIGEMRSDVSKLTADQLNTKKQILNMEALISHCETEIGFKELKA